MPVSSYRKLKRPAGVQVIEQVAFVRLVPTDLTGWDSAQIQTPHVGRREEAPDEATVIRDRRDHQARTHGPDRLMHRGPAFSRIDATNRSRYFPQSSMQSSPMTILLWPRPWISIRGSPCQSFVEETSPNTIPRPQCRRISPPPP